MVFVTDFQGDSFSVDVVCRLVLIGNIDFLWGG